MEDNELSTQGWERPVDVPSRVGSPPGGVVADSPPDHATNDVPAGGVDGGSGCPTCGGHGALIAEPAARGGPAPPPYVYALGRIVPRIPSLGLEKELAQATGRAETADLTDRQALHAVLSEPRNRYLARQLCYVFTVQGLDTYLLRPRDPVDFDQLIEALRESPRLTDLHVVIGIRGPLASPDQCNGSMLPIVAFDQIFAFNTDSLVQSLPKPDGLDESTFRSSAEELFERVLQVADNAGSEDEHRAVNYLAVRYPRIYAKCAEAHASGASLTSIETRPSRLSGMRRIMDVIFSFTDRKTDVTEKFFVRVDVEEENVFLQSKLNWFYDR